MKCKDCKYWDNKGNPQFVYGDCRRMPPQSEISVDVKPGPYRDQYNINITKFPHATFPNVKEDEWCGEYSPAQVE